MTRLTYTGTPDKCAPRNGRLHDASGADFFAQAKEKARLEGVPVPKDAIIVDGEFHRDRCDPKDTKKSWTYVARGDGVPNVDFYDHRRGGDKPIFSLKGTMPDGMGAARIAEEFAANKAKREAEKAEGHANAATEAARMWAAAQPASPEHPYVKAKGIRPHIARQLGGLLLVPVFHGGDLAGLQKIWPDGKKKQFLSGTPASGGYCVIGELPEPGGPVLIAEGFATGATLHEVTGHAVIVAFFADNLLPAALALKHSLPGVEFVVCADDDWKRVDKKTGLPENIGLIKAREAALSIGAKLAVPDFRRFERGEKDTDFNDLHKLDSATCNALDGRGQCSGASNARHLSKTRKTGKGLLLLLLFRMSRCHFFGNFPRAISSPSQLSAPRWGAWRGRFRNRCAIASRHLRDCRAGRSGVRNTSASRC